VSKIDCDFRLLDVSLEIYSLEDYLNLVEQTIYRLQDAARQRLEEIVRDQKLSWPEDEDERQQCDYEIDEFLPRFFRAPFIVTLYAVYESAVKEVADLIKKKQGNALSLGDIRGDCFLERARKYYKHVLDFELCSDASSWERIMLLSRLRNEIAHANGRIVARDDEARKKKIQEWEEKYEGIHVYGDYIIVDSSFVKETSHIVRKALEDLVDRYKKWDTASRST